MIIFVLLLGALLVYLAATGRVVSFWEAMKNPQGK